MGAYDHLSDDDPRVIEYESRQAKQIRGEKIINEPRQDISKMEWESTFDSDVYWTDLKHGSISFRYSNDYGVKKLQSHIINDGYPLKVSSFQEAEALILEAAENTMKDLHQIILFLKEKKGEK
jgi:hypothetical protein